MKYKSLLALSMAGMLSACGGGSGSTTTSTDTTVSTATTTDYLGAATAGDFASFSMDSNGLLSFSLSGVHFDGVSGQFDATNVVGGFYTATVDGNPLGLFMSGNLGLAVLPDSGLNTPFIVGLANSSIDTASIVDKDYIYIGWVNNAAVANIVTLSSDGTLAIKDLAEVAANENGDPTAPTITSGCWSASANGDYINVLTGIGQDCSAVDETSTASNYLRAVIKPGASRAGFVVDYADGSGFGIGLERKVLASPAAEVTYDIFSMDFANIAFDTELFERLVVNAGDATTDASEYNINCTDISNCTDSTDLNHRFNIHYNHVCATGANASNMVPFDGMACVEVIEQGAGNTTPLPLGTLFNTMIDDEDGYFIAQLEGASVGDATWTSRMTLGGKR